MISQILVAVMDVPHRWTAPPSRIDLRRANSRLSLRARNMPVEDVHLANDSPVMVLKPPILEKGLDMKISLTPPPAAPKRNLKTTARAVSRLLFKKRTRSHAILDTLSSTFSVASGGVHSQEPGIRAPDNTPQTQPFELPGFPPHPICVPSFGPPSSPSSLLVRFSQSDYVSDISIASSISAIFPRLQLSPFGSIAEDGIPFGSSSMLVASASGSGIADETHANILLARINLTSQKIDALKRAMEAEKALLEAQKIHLLTHEGLLTNLFARVEALELTATLKQQQLYHTRDVSVSACMSMICPSPPTGLPTSPALGDDTMKNLLRETTLCFSPATDTGRSLNKVAEVEFAENMPFSLQTSAEVSNNCEDTSFSFGDELSTKLSVDPDWVYRGISAYSAEVPLEDFRDTSVSLQVMPATSTSDIDQDPCPVDFSAGPSESIAVEPEKVPANEKASLLKIDENIFPVGSLSRLSPFSGRSRSVPLGAITAFTLQVSQSVLVHSPLSPVKNAFSGFIQKRS